MNPPNHVVFSNQPLDAGAAPSCSLLAAANQLAPFGGPVQPTRVGSRGARRAAPPAFISYDQMHLQTSLDWPHPLQPALARQFCIGGGALSSPDWTNFGTARAAAPHTPLARSWPSAAATAPGTPLAARGPSLTAALLGSAPGSRAGSRPATSASATKTWSRPATSGSGVEACIRPATADVADEASRAAAARARARQQGGRQGSRPGTATEAAASTDAAAPRTPGSRPTSSAAALRRRVTQRNLSSIGTLLNEEDEHCRYFPTVERLPFRANVDASTSERVYWKNTFQPRYTDQDLGRNMVPGGPRTKLIGSQWKWLDPPAAA